LDARVVSDEVELLREQIERCRCLAEHADPYTEKRLLDLAAEYETRIFELEKGYRPSPASRLLKPGEANS
jgi:hypothetical protein